MSTRHTLTRDDTERLIDRLHAQSIERRREHLTQLDSRYYPVAPPCIISSSQLAQSIDRQVEQEVARRQKNAATRRLDAPTQSPARSQRPLLAETIDASVFRLYNKAMQNKEKVAASSNQQEKAMTNQNYPAQPTKKISLKEMQVSVHRLSVPRKNIFTIDEINKVYGL